MNKSTLWLLHPVNPSKAPWKPWYDKCFGFVIRANSENEARALADSEGGDENDNALHPWLNPELSTCEPLSNKGKPGIVIQDFRSA